MIFRLNFAIPAGKLVAVVGKVGSGKSSLIQALTGDMKKLVGRVVINVCAAIIKLQ